MNETIKLISLNIEGDNHYSTVLPFLQKENPDVVCLQEVYESDIPILIAESGMFATFTPLSIVDKDFPERHMKAKGAEGLLILSKKMPFELHKDYYVGSLGSIPIFKDEEPFVTNRALLSIKVEYSDAEFCIATTHFTWTNGGKMTSIQEEDFQHMLEAIQNLKGFVLAGDFNAPRGKEIYTELSRLYKDNIPAGVTSTIDPLLHKVKNLQHVVDGIFSTTQYIVTNVQVIDGISDHKAITASVKLRLL